jgi:hypothetical protein
MDPNDNVVVDDEYAVDANADRGDAIEASEAATADAVAKAAADAAAVAAAIAKTGEKTEEEKEAEEAAKVERDEKGRFKAKEEDDEEEEEDDKNYAIRINKMREQRDREREENARLKAELDAARQVSAVAAKAEAVDPAAEINERLETLYEQVEELRADAKTKEAAAAQREIDKLNRELATMQATAVATHVTTATRDNLVYDSMLDVVEATFPQLQPGHEEFDPKLVAELDFQVKAYEGAGLPGPAALRRAVSLLFRVDPWSPKKAEPAPAKKDEVVAKPVDKSKQVAKAKDHETRQPPATDKVGGNVDDQHVNVASLSDAEFDALPESKKARLRGDI